MFDHLSPSKNTCIIHPLAPRTLMFLAKSAHFFGFDPKWGSPLNGYYGAFLFSGTSHNLFPSTTMDQVQDQGPNQDQGQDQAKAQEISILGELLTVFNLTEQYLQLGDWLSKLKNVRVLQLGRWEHNVKHHIEAFNPETKKNEKDVYLNGSGTQKSLKYLSLRGVSRMTSLPPAVAKLSSLEILDLSDC